jgi:DNA (cytosine-5)-methyltransferase 1
MKVGSMFAGIGGICLGFLRSGAQVVWANEIDAEACKTYRHNFGDNYLVEGDIREVDPHGIPDIDVLTAGFPCQPFSIAGRQKGFNDPRGNLFFEIARVIDVKRPPIVFLENVPNLVEHDDGKTFLVIYNTLVQFGYYVKYQVLSAYEHGNIPQKRDRIFIVAFLDYEQCAKFKFPEPVEATKKISDIINVSVKHSACYYYTESNFYYADMQRIVTDKSAIYKINDDGVVKKRYELCPTLTANMGTYPDRVPLIRDDFGIRKLTPKECLDFQGFPKEYAFPAKISLNAAYKQVGNSVCVPAIKQIAEQIIDVFKKAQEAKVFGYELNALMLDGLNLSTRALAALKRGTGYKVEAVSQLLKYSEADLLKGYYLGDKILQEIKEKLAEHGFVLAKK